ncbi:uncharacterized protein [Palaemon carinicauda]|uniref:uncharacterized protein n=1 Tax=Palaemon carinicauda TaxID=392227 RepID=UPI0035B58AEB
MMLVNIVQVTLFHVTLLIAFTTAQPFPSLSSNRHSDFEWNTRKVGEKKVASIAIRKEEERDRRSVVVGESDGGVLNVKTVSSRHHHHQHHRPRKDVTSPIVKSKEQRSSFHYHRHQRGEITYPSEIDWLTDGGTVSREYLSDGWIPAEETHNHSEVVYSSKQPNEILRTDESLINSRKLEEILLAVGLDIDAEVFGNVTQVIEKLRKKKEAKRTGQKKKKSKKVKRDKRRKGKKDKKRERKKKCKHLRGREKKRCRAETQNRVSATTLFTPSSMSGSEACQYHNLEECSRKVGFLELPRESVLTVVKCRYREQFFDCMEELRLETCDPNFKTEGDMKALRTQIRQAIHTTNSCLISEVLEG